ncbi:foldase protein PrsA precursor [Andreesenia angusta]|uniref:Foldase protein PrsA n=1 Tax=Andreesenia angusta TaxID=39480 RepID=A0A1S1V5A8_9FIRM|nr:peptidylprolyl isomerase [Andreesenia angusta]OHW61762.1 foldase protein PrsA precursor [Andreesenia angusta]
MFFNIRKKSAIMVSTVLVGSMFLTACSEGELAAKVNGEGVTMAEYNQVFEMVKSPYVSQYGEESLSQEMGEGMTLEKMLSEQVMDNLIFNEVLVQDAEKRDIKVSKDELEKSLKEFKEQYGGEEGYKKFLEENKIEQKDFEKMLEENLMLESHAEQVKKEMKVSEAEVKDYYEQNKDYLSQVKASHILIGAEAKEGATEEEIAKVEEEAKAKATEISEAIKSGKKFEDYVDQSTEPGAAERKGDLGYFGKGQMVPEFEEAAFSMKVGEISEPVKTQYGYHIIKLVDKKDTIESLKSDIENAIKDQKYNEYANELKEKAKIEILLKKEETKDSVEAKDGADGEEKKSEEKPAEDGSKTETKTEE